jgi:hypothetical protein
MASSRGPTALAPLILGGGLALSAAGVGAGASGVAEGPELAQATRADLFGPLPPAKAEATAAPATREGLFGPSPPAGTGAAVAPASQAAPPESRPAAQAEAPAAPATRQDLFGPVPSAVPGPSAPAPPAAPAAPEPALAAAEEGAGTQLSGFLRSQVAYTYADPEHWSLFQNLAQLSASGRLGDGVGWKAGVRGFVDPVYASSGFYPGEVRDDQKLDGWVWETYLDFATGPLEWRVGRQHIVWGEVIAFFFADVVSAFDQRQFILEDFEYSRLPQWAARAEWFAGDFHAEAVWVPVMTYDEIGKPGADFYPFDPDPVAGFTTVLHDDDRPGDGIGNSGYGLRASYLKGGWDGSLFFWSAPDRYPVFEREVSLAPVPTIGYRPIHERVHQVGGTLAKDLGPAVVKVEAVYTNGQLFETASVSEADGLVRRDQLDWVGSLEFSFQDDTRLNVQLGQSRVFDHAPEMLREDVANAASLLVSTRTFHPKVEPELLWVTSLDETDWSLQARVTWEFQPNWRLVGGVDSFNGPSDGLFGRFDDQDRVYGEVRYDF